MLCKERERVRERKWIYLLRASSRRDCSSALHSVAKPESCFKLTAFSPLPLEAGVPFALETTAPFVDGATDATSVGAEYLGEPFPFPFPAFWLVLCNCALTAELLLAFACAFGPDPAIAD